MGRDASIILFYIPLTLFYLALTKQSNLIAIFAHGGKRQMSSLQERRIVREESIKPYKTPQQKRQRLIAVIVVLVIAALGAGAYFLLVPREKYLYGH